MEFQNTSWTQPRNLKPSTANLKYPKAPKPETRTPSYLFRFFANFSSSCLVELLCELFHLSCCCCCLCVWGSVYVCLCVCVCACLFACLLACLLARLLDCSLACSFACLLACLLACFLFVASGCGPLELEGCGSTDHESCQTFKPLPARFGVAGFIGFRGLGLTTFSGIKNPFETTEFLARRIQQMPLNTNSGSSTPQTKQTH